jgi:hypothetical protein
MLPLYVLGGQQAKVHASKAEVQSSWFPVWAGMRNPAFDGGGLEPVVPAVSVTQL